MARAAAACPGIQDYQADYKREREGCGSASKRVQMTEWIRSEVTSGLKCGNKHLEIAETADHDKQPR